MSDERPQPSLWGFVKVLLLVAVGTVALGVLTLGTCLMLAR
jgi:hypothetical protein